MTGFVSDNANFAIMETAVEADTIISYKLLYGDSKTITQIFKFHLWNTLAIEMQVKVFLVRSQAQELRLSRKTTLGRFVLCLGTIRPIILTRQ
jgi:hypothetical protein